jgi:uncharacterized OB-fold protein
MTVTAARFLPIADPDTAPFWEACREHRLVAQRCADCGAFRFPPSPLCDRCRSWSATWEPLPLPGRLYSWIVTHHSVVPDFLDLPYVVGIVEFDVDVRVPGRVLVEPDECVAGMPLDVTFEDVTPSVSLPHFVPA